MPADHALLWYRMERVLGHGGFGITHLAADSNLEKQVAIKEYLPREFAIRDADESIRPLSAEHEAAYRWGLERFLFEARTLARFSHPNIVQVLSVFEANNTAYMVMVYEIGASLAQVLKIRRQLDEAALKAIAIPVINGLQQVHEAGFIHRDIKPSNIYLRNDGQPVLIDFGSARQAFGLQTHTVTSLYSPGYAAFEQYHSSGDRQGIWTDIYGLGATLYHGVAGSKPLPAIDRSAVLLEGGNDRLIAAVHLGAGSYSPSFLSAIDHAVALRPADRPRSLAEWREELLGAAGGGDEPTQSCLPGTPPAPSEPERETIVNLDLPRLRNDDVRAAALPESRHLRHRTPARAVVLLAVLGACAYALYSRVPDITRPPSNSQDITATAAHARPVTGADAGTTAKAEVEASSTRIAALLAAAEESLSAGRLIAPAGDNASERYREALALDPDNSTALAGLETVERALVAGVDAAIETGKLDAGEERLKELSGYKPEATAIADLEQRLESARAEQQAQGEVDALLSAARAAMDAGRIVSPEEDNALEKYQQLNRLRPNMAAVREAYIDIGNHLMTLANKASAAGRFAEAHDYLDTAKSILPDRAEIDEARKFVDLRQTWRQRDSAATRAVPVTGPHRSSLWSAGCRG